MSNAKTKVAKKKKEQIAYSKISLNELKFVEGDLFKEGGGFGSVRRALWKSHPVAVKTFSAEEKYSFKDEFRNLNKLSHPNIVQLYGANPTSQIGSYIVMEYAHNSLAKVLHYANHQYRYTAHHVYWWALQVAKGLQYMHRAKIIHRDIKSTNMLLFGDGQCLKLCDFGTARDISQTMEMTKNVGTIRYMAPEVLRGEAYTEKCDVFSFSIVLWEMIARKPPNIKFGQRMPWEMIYYAMAKQGARPPKIKGIHPFFEKLINSGWCDQPVDRPNSSDILHKLEAIEKFFAPCTPLERLNRNGEYKPFDPSKVLSNKKFLARKKPKRPKADDGSNPESSLDLLEMVERVKDLSTEDQRGSSQNSSMDNAQGPSSQPGSGPSKPVTDPSKPVTDPSKPVTDPSKPVTDPSKPVTDPSTPVTDPSKPVTDPSKPVTDPSTPVTDPSTPVTDPSQPVTDPPQPVTDPPQPVTDPSQPVTDPSQPVADPSQPVADPSQPVTDPSQPVTDPSQPVTDPSQPVTDPSQPVTDPSQPVTDPSQPVTDPSQPVTDPSKPSKISQGNAVSTEATEMEDDDGRDLPPPLSVKSPVPQAAPSTLASSYSIQGPILYSPPVWVNPADLSNTVSYFTQGTPYWYSKPQIDSQTSVYEDDEEWTQRREAELRSQHLVKNLFEDIRRQVSKESQLATQKVRVEKAAKGSRYAVEGLTDDRWQPIVPASNPESQAKHEEYGKLLKQYLAILSEHETYDRRQSELKSELEHQKTANEEQKIRLETYQALCDKHDRLYKERDQLQKEVESYRRKIQLETDRVSY